MYTLKIFTCEQALKYMNAISVREEPQTTFQSSSIAVFIKHSWASASGRVG